MNFHKTALLFVHPETNYSEPQTLIHRITNHLLTKVPTIRTARYSLHTVINVYCVSQDIYVAVCVNPTRTGGTSTFQAQRCFLLLTQQYQRYRCENIVFPSTVTPQLMLVWVYRLFLPPLHCILLCCCKFPVHLFNCLPSTREKTAMGFYILSK